MDVYLATVSKREVRAYADRPLPDDAVRRLLEAGRLAGSSRNRQTRRFVALRDRALIERAAQNMMLAASGDGIGSCPNGVADPGALATLLGHGDDEQVATVLSFGYPARPVDAESRTPEQWIERADRLAFDEGVELR